MSYAEQVSLRYAQGGIDAAGRVRVSQETTLGDYKVLNADRALLWENAGTGTGTFTNNTYTMAVTSGQWLVRQTRKFHGYFSGKSQMPEFTFDNFAPQTNVIKRVGYFSSNAVSPFDTTYDGYWLESDGTTIRLKMANAGSSTLNVAITSWSGYGQLGIYQTLSNWDKFTVCLTDFLWLGGAVMRLWIKVGNDFVLAHQFDYAGTAAGVFMKSPNQPMRYEIRSSTGTGTMTAICCQVTTEGSINEAGLGRSISTGSTLIACAAAGTTYPLLALRKATTSRDIAAAIHEANIFVGSNADQGILTVQINPTLSAALTYAAVSNSALESAVGNGTITVTAAGTIIFSSPVAQSVATPNTLFKDNFLSFLGGTLANTMDQYVLCLTNITATINAAGFMSWKEF